MRSTIAEINLKNLNSNLINIRKKIGRHPFIMAVVKANAYGHGAVEVTKSIVKNKTAQYFGVAIAEEGIELREHFKNIPIHVFTVPNPKQYSLFVQYNLEPTVCALNDAKKLHRAAKSAGKILPVHIKVDTGMGRIGVTADDAVNFVKSVKKFSHLDIKGIFTHFATSDEKDLTFANEQLTKFRSIVTQLELLGIHIPLVHCANSGAILQMPDSYFDMVRAGIMMYGYAPSLETKRTVNILPALSLKAEVGFVKIVEKNTSISYSRRYFTKRKTKIASVTIGYADGFNRKLTNNAFALIKGKKYPIVGTVCMDQIMIDVGLKTEAAIGDEVVLMGSSGDKKITAWDLSQSLSTIPYEICCAVSARVPRKFIYAK